MEFIADLHLHSKYSRATSEKMNVINLSNAAKTKGLNLLGTGDFTHPKWLKEIKENLTPVDGSLFRYKGIFWMLTVEVSTIYEQGGKVRKIHHVIHAPSFEIVDQINEALSKYTDLSIDGRPILGKLTSPELVETLTKISDKILIYPAHAWTSWFGCLGSKSGFDSIEECYQDQTKHIHALETGLSSDPLMNWRISKLDRYTLVSNSDSHSPYSHRLGRECNVFDLDVPTYDGINNAIKNKDRKRFLMTIEFYPEQGKYHYDGHRNCDVVLSPKEAQKYNNICPVCRRPLTIGVLHRVEELADRPAGFKPDNTIPFKSLVPLSELIAALLKTGVATKKVWQESNKLISAFDSELNVLLKAPEDALREITHPKIADAIIKNREGKVEIKPGYDGVYGKPILGEAIKETKAKPIGQKTLGEF